MTDYFFEIQAPSQINTDVTLNPGDSLYSPTRAFRMAMQSDGNLVLYAIDDKKLNGNKNLWMQGAAEWALLSDQSKPTNIYTHALWSSNSEGYSNASAHLQWDGNFVIRSTNKPPLSVSNTDKLPGSTNCLLCCQDDGNLVMYAGNGTNVLWTTKTNARA